MGEPSKVLVISPLKMKSNSDIEYKAQVLKTEPHSNIGHACSSIKG